MDAQLRAVLVARLRAMGASAADAEDCVQEALVEGWSKSSAGDRAGDRVAWLAAVARNKYVDAVRRRARETSVGLAPADAPDRVAEGPEDQVVGRAHARFLVGRLRRLPPVTQEVCHAVGGEVNRSELASSLGLSSRSVESHLTRARRLLRIQGALGWTAVLAAAGVAAARRTFGPRLAAKTAAAALTAGLALLPVADNAKQPTAPTIAAPPPQAAPAVPIVQTPAPAAPPIASAPTGQPEPASAAHPAAAPAPPPVRRADPQLAPIGIPLPVNTSAVTGPLARVQETLPGSLAEPFTTLLTPDVPAPGPPPLPPLPDLLGP